MTPATGWGDYNEMCSRFHGASPGLPHPRSLSCFARCSLCGQGALERKREGERLYSIPEGMAIPSIDKV